MVILPLFEMDKLKAKVVEVMETSEFVDCPLMCPLDEITLERGKFGKSPENTIEQRNNY